MSAAIKDVKELDGHPIRVDLLPWFILARSSFTAIVELANVIRDGVDELHTLRDIVDSKGRDG
jgi:hypothetical protein